MWNRNRSKMVSDSMDGPPPQTVPAADDRSPSPVPMRTSPTPTTRPSTTTPSHPAPSASATISTNAPRGGRTPSPSPVADEPAKADTARHFLSEQEIDEKGWQLEDQWTELLYEEAHMQKTATLKEARDIITASEAALPSRVSREAFYRAKARADRLLEGRTNSALSQRILGGPSGSSSRGRGKARRSKSGGVDRKGKGKASPAEK